MGNFNDYFFLVTRHVKDLTGLSINDLPVMGFDLLAAWASGKTALATAKALVLWINDAH